jgi:hypothetical protein
MSQGDFGSLKSLSKYFLYVYKINYTTLISSNANLLHWRGDWFSASFILSWWWLLKWFVLFWVWWLLTISTQVYTGGPRLSLSLLTLCFSDNFGMLLVYSLSREQFQMWEFILQRWKFTLLHLHVRRCGLRKVHNRIWWLADDSPQLSTQRHLCHLGFQIQQLLQ